MTKYAVIRPSRTRRSIDHYKQDHGQQDHGIKSHPAGHAIREIL